MVRKKSTEQSCIEIVCCILFFWNTLIYFLFFFLHDLFFLKKPTYFSKWYIWPVSPLPSVVVCTRRSLLRWQPLPSVSCPVLKFSFCQNVSSKVVVEHRTKKKRHKSYIVCKNNICLCIVMIQRYQKVYYILQSYSHCSWHRHLLHGFF